MQSLLRRRPRAMTRDEDGFTLVELLAALTVMAIVMLAVAGVFYGAMRTAGVGGRRTAAVGLAIRETEAMHAVPYGQLGFATTQAGYVSQYEGHATVDFVASSTITSPQVAPNGSDVQQGITYNLARYIVWMDADATHTEAYKRTTVVVTYTDDGGSHNLRQDSVVYPGGQGTYGGPRGATASSTTTTTAPAAFPPSAPTNLSASVPSGVPGETTVNLTWTAPASSNPAVNNWIVEYSVAPDSTMASPATANGSLPAANTSYAVAGLSPGTTYYFRVRAQASNGLSSTPTSIVSATTNTSTSSAACAAGTMNVTPATAEQKNSSGKLLSDVNVTVNMNGNCSSSVLTVRYSPTSSSPTTA
ncbi:MAG: Fibronectin type domain, partial [Acidimicrobiaceae bacterium]|nr:Fibronectin type domain [Acidimicrobiaceae bacterium]